MQMNYALNLRKAWGDKKCGHPHLVKEYLREKETGDWICTTCGEEFLKSERDELKKSRE